MIVFTIYCHTCTVTGKKYVGQTTKKNVMRRWSEHVCHALRESGGCLALGRAIRKYGRDKWTHEVLETCASQEAANFAETKWIEQLNTIAPNGYNLDFGGVVPRHPNVGEKIRQTRAAKSPEWQAAQNRLLREAHAQHLATTSSEDRSLAASAAWATMSPEKRAETRQKMSTSRSSEERSVATRRWQALQTKEERSEIARRRQAAKTSEERSESARKGASSLSTEVRCRLADRAASLTHEQRSQKANKAWVTKRLKSALTLSNFTLVGTRTLSP